MTDPKRTRTEPLDSAPARDPLDITDLPENEADGSDVKGGTDNTTVKAPAPPSSSTVCGYTYSCSPPPR